MSQEALQLFFESVLGQISTVAVIILLLITIMKISGKKNDASIMVKSAIILAITFVLNQITLFKMPQGGSITAFGMLSLFLISYLYGARQGILAGIAYGLIDLIISPSIVHPIQLLMDYPLGFAAIGIGGILRNQNFGIIKGYILGAVGRYIVVVLSGIIFWGMYAPEGFNAISWSVFYNMTYMLPEAVATVAILFIPQVRTFFDKYKEN